MASFACVKQNVRTDLIIITVAVDMRIERFDQGSEEISLVMSGWVRECGGMGVVDDGRAADEGGTWCVRVLVSTASMASTARMVWLV